MDDYPGKIRVWAEIGRAPAVVLELGSPTTVQNDLTHKRDLDERLQVREYFCYDDERRVMVAHCLVGSQYVALLPKTSGGRRSEGIGLKLVLWVGACANVRQSWLEWAIREGELIPIPAEAAEQAEGLSAAAETEAPPERALATAAESRATQAERRPTAAELEHRRLQDRLRSLGYTEPPE